jgi:hypothetical protein
MSNKRVFQTLRKRKKALAAMIALVLLSMTTYSSFSNEIPGQDNNTTHYLGEVVAIPGQVVEREYLLPDGGHVKTRVSLNDPQDVQRFLEAMQDAEWLDKQASAGQP